MSFFLTDQLELRGGWRFATYVMAYVAVYMLTSALLSELVPGPVNFGEVRGLLLTVATFTPPAVLAFLFMLRFVERKPVRAFGIALHERWSRDLAVGLGVALFMATIFLAGGFLTGDWRAVAASGSGPTLLITAGLLAIAAANEELVYRGYPLQALITAVGPGGAVVVMSTLFGLGHYLNPNATWLGTLNVCLAGALLSLAYLRTRSLWLPYGIHLGWNLVTGVVLGLPVSGVRLSSFWRIDPDGPAWLTGGSFGPEGGVLASVAIIAAAVAVGTSHRVDVSPTVRAALEDGSGRGTTRKH